MNINNTKLLCLLLKAQKITKSSEQGYSMLVVSMLTIVMFSLVLAATSLSNLTKSRTNAFVDSNSSFYVAEAGLNRRAAEISAKLKGYAGIQGSLSSKTVASCYGIGIPAGGNGASERAGNDDLECVNYRFQSTNNIANATSGGNILLDSNGATQNNYVAYTVVNPDTSNYDATSGVPNYSQIPPGDDYAGLNAAEYRYKVESIGRKPIALSPGSTTPVYTNAQIAAKNRETTTPAALLPGDAALITAYNAITAQATAARTAATNSAQDSSNNTILSMTFVQRVIPLFQFGIFYNGDLELNPTASMEINGRVHSNANMYLQPTRLDGDTTSTATFMDKVSATGDIYNRVDAWVAGVGRTGITRLLRTGAANGQVTDYDSALTTPLTAAQITTSGILNKQLESGVTALKTPSPGFTRKRNYVTNEIGEYFAKADMRLEMVPDRDVDGTSRPTTSVWPRNTAKIPFNFTAIRTGSSTTDACTTAAPTAGSDPAASYVDPSRENRSGLRCYALSKGQLQSLRQPVMVLTNINQIRNTGAKTVAQFRDQETAILSKATPLGTVTLPTPPSLTFTPTVTTATDRDTAKKKVIRALQVAIASTPKPLSLDTLDQRFDGSVFVSGDLATFKSTFSTLIDTITELSHDDQTILLRAKPTEIAALQINGVGAWFLPAPIQRIETATTDANNRRSSGFYDGRERRWITMLQTNIASLSVWNRDGLYVNDTTAIIDPYNSDYVTAIDPAFTNVTSASPTTDNFASGLAFDRVTTFTKSDGTEIYPIDSLQYLGLGSSDKTEGGLVLHATVSDDLDGDGTSANNVTIGSGNNQRILKKDSQNRTLDADGAVTTTNPLVLDRYRTYPNQTASKESPFAFAFNGGNYLPNAMMLVSDQSIYVQGNFNNNSTTPSNTANTTANTDRLPAAIVADTITVLSNQCLAGAASSSNVNSVSPGQLSCGFPGTATTPYGSVTDAIAINAAFLSNTQVSNGNLGAGRGSSDVAANKSYSGGANNYIRLLEDWYNGGTPIRLNYSGSLISLNEPIEFGGLYRPGGVDSADPVGTSYYNVPFRNVGYDTNFNTVTKIPPLTPKVSYIQRSNFNRQY